MYRKLLSSAFDLQVREFTGLQGSVRNPLAEALETNEATYFDRFIRGTKGGAAIFSVWDEVNELFPAPRPLEGIDPGL